MTFDQWCESKYIKGNWKEALFHHILATRSKDEINDPEEWVKAWNEVLHHISGSFPSSFEYR
jgi:hypothetical protein